MKGEDPSQNMVDEGQPEPPLAGVSIGLTAGPTRAWIDPVRYLANASTGVLGALIADQLASMGAAVTAILGPGAVPPSHSSIRLIHIETPDDLLGTLQQLASSEEGRALSCWIHAMAVLDYIPAVTETTKISSDLGEWSLSLKPTPKIIQHLKILFPRAGLIGFKLSSTDDPQILRQAAIELAKSASCDLVVANPPPFGNPSVHSAWFWESKSASWTGPVQGKPGIAHVISSWILQHSTAGNTTNG